DRGGRYVSGQKIGHRVGICAYRVVRQTCRPRPLGAVEHKLTQRMAEVELVHMPLAEFAAEAELVLAEVIGNDVRQHPRDVIAAFRGSDPDLFEPAYGDIGRTQNRLSVNQGIRAEEQAVRLRVEAV